VAFTGLIYFCIPGLDLGLGLDTSGLVNIPVFALLYYSSIAPLHHNKFYNPFSGTTRVSRCQNRTSGLYGARRD